MTLNLLYIQTVSDVELNWVQGTQETEKQLARMQVLIQPICVQDAGAHLGYLCSRSGTNRIMQSCAPGLTAWIFLHRKIIDSCLLYCAH